MLPALLALAAAQVAWALAADASAADMGPAGVEPARVGACDAWSPWLPAAASRSMLAVFLSANVLTGGVNMAINTLAVPDAAARGILLLYMAAVVAVAVGLEAGGIVIRL